jgi:toxin-antitoxin system PIN domain toxin
MIAVDTNVMVYAHREQLPQHERALEWLTYLAEGHLPWAIPVFCLGEFVRVVTHPRVFDPPSNLEQALSALENVLLSPTLRLLNPGPRYPVLLSETIRAADARGNLVYDAQIVAVCREQGASQLLTLDRDFARFPDIQVITLDKSPDSVSR